MDLDKEKLKDADTLFVSRTFYERYGSRMIREQFPAYESRIAVGLVGEGSECFGFDDEISRDHDFGLGFCMWLNEEDYKAVGSDLQMAYRNLIETEGAAFSESVWGKPLTLSNQRFEGRRGVMEIGAFYGNTLRLQPSLDLQTILLHNFYGLCLVHLDNIIELICYLGSPFLNWIPVLSRNPVPGLFLHNYCTVYRCNPIVTHVWCCLD